jgi:hypothetical protein
MTFKQNGTTRLVFVFRRFVIKIPNFTCQHDHFLNGCSANWRERKYWKQWRHTEEMGTRLCPTIFCSWFGLIQIQRKAAILPNDYHLSENELLPFGDFASDNKPQNFGYYKGNLVMVDYA